MRYVTLKNTGSVIFGDNVRALAVGKQVGFSSKMRHLDLRLQFLQDWVQRGAITLLYCPTQFMIADILTKVPGPAIFNMLRPRLMGQLGTGTARLSVMEEDCAAKQMGGVKVNRGG